MLRCVALLLLAACSGGDEDLRVDGSIDARSEIDARPDVRDGRSDRDDGALPDREPPRDADGSSDGDATPDAIPDADADGASDADGEAPDADGAADADATFDADATSDADADADAGDADATVPMIEPAPGGDPSCGSTLETVPIAPSGHVRNCTLVTYATNPPTSGPHYDNWAEYKTYDAPVAQGFIVHSLEHGAVAIHYNCDTTCDEDLAALADFLAAREADPVCFGGIRHRIIVVPDPDLEVRFAAAAWGFALRSDCFDLGALETFLDDHYGRTSENFCSGGIDPLDPRNGFPDNCGEP